MNCQNKKSHCIIEIDKGIAELEKEMNNKLQEARNKKIIEKHKENFKVWYDEKDNRYKTYLPKNGKRGMTAKRKEEDLETAIIEYYEEKEDTAPLFKDVYLEWLVFKSSETRASGTIKRFSVDWNRFYKNSKIATQKIDKLDPLELQIWLNKLIIKENLTKTSFYNMYGILNQTLKYAKRKGYINNIVLDDVEIKTKNFKAVVKKTDGSQVFNTDETPKILKRCYDDFLRNNLSSTPLAIALSFQLGTRIGETVALKFSDIDKTNKYITISRQEVRAYKLNEKTGESTYISPKVAEYTKSDDGIRTLLLTDEAKKIIELLRNANKTNGNYDDDFLFVYRNKRIVENTIIQRLYKYCAECGISRKSTHKIRKTYISTLKYNNVPTDEIRRIAGHKDEKTTRNSYCYNILTLTDTEKIVLNALKMIS